MPIYQVTRKSDSEHVYQYSADAPIEWTGMEFATHDHIEQVEIDPDGVIEGTVTGRTMTKLEYLRRFTAEERITIRTVAKTNPMLEDYMALMELASEIDTADADTKAGVQMLESVGLLAPGRATEILA
jgi:hypothetical protein